MFDDQTKMNTKEKDVQSEFDSTWRELAPSLAAYFFRRGCARRDIEDLMQETALIAIKNQVTVKGDFRSWVFGIANNIFRDYIRREIKTSANSVFLNEIFEPKNDFDAINNKTSVNQLIKTANIISREMLILYYVEGYTFKKISKNLGIPLSTVHFTIRKALKMIKDEQELLSSMEGAKNDKEK